MIVVIIHLVFVAVNFVRAKVSEIIQAFKEVGTEVEPIAGVPGCLRVHGAKAFKTPRIKRLFKENEEAAMARYDHLARRA